MFRAQPVASAHPGSGASQGLARCRPSHRSRWGRRIRPVDQRHRPAAGIGIAGRVVALRGRRSGHRRRPARQPDLPPQQRVDRHRRTFRAVLVISRRGRGPARQQLPRGKRRRRTAAGGYAGRRCTQPADRPPRRRKMPLPGQSPERRTTPSQPCPQPLLQPFGQMVRAPPRWRPARRRRGPDGRRQRGAGMRVRGGGHRSVPCAARPG